MSKKKSQEKIEVAPKEEENQLKDVEILGKLKEDKQKSPIIVLAIMIFLIAIMFFLPNITAFITERQMKEEEGVTLVPPTGKEDDDEDEEENLLKDDKFYSLDINTQITFDNVVYSDFRFSNENDYYLSFSAINNNQNEYNLTTKNIYFELYDQQEVLLERTKIEGSIASNERINLKNLISLDTISNTQKLKIVIINEEEYPSYQVSLNESNEYLLTCLDNGRTLSYYFDEDGGLIKINDKFSYTNSEDLELYSSILTEYKELNKSLENQIGITTSLVESGLSFVYETNIDLANVTNLDNKLYYKRGTLAKNIKFELEASRYSCE